MKRRVTYTPNTGLAPRANSSNSFFSILSEIVCAYTKAFVQILQNKHKTCCHAPLPPFNISEIFLKKQMQTDSEMNFAQIHGQKASPCLLVLR